MQKNALVTGASTGIGYELATLLAADGYNLALVARDETKLTARAAEFETRYKTKSIVLAKDLSDPKAPAAIAEELHRHHFPVSVLVNNAGFGVYGDFIDNKLEDEMALMQVNMLALVHLTKLFLKPMIERKAGRILNVSSVVAFQPGPRLALYSASKAFVQSFSVALSVETEGTGVTVTALCPGATESEFQKRAGMGKAKSFDTPGYKPMSAQSVAKVGYEAMWQGKPWVVAGWKNKLTVAVSRRGSMVMSAKVAGRLNRDR